jgi:tetratricopeptide (TPR) repeat protein
MLGAMPRTPLIGFCLFGAVLIAYAPVAHHEFVNYDDLMHVVHNPQLTRPATLSNLLAHFYQPFGGNLLPVYWISLHLGLALHGPDPTPILLGNALIHAISGVLLFAALRRLTGAVWRSAFVAAVFGLHPLHVESVAWAVERKDVLAGFFWMLGLYAYARYAEDPRSRSRYLAVLLCLALGLMSKSTVVTFPFVLLLLDVWPLNRLRGDPRRVLLEKAPMFALVAFASVVTLLAQSETPIFAAGTRVGIGARVANAIESCWSYLCDALWPVGLAALYPHPYLMAPPSRAEALTAGALGAALLAITALVLYASRKRPYLGVGWLWYLGTLVPVIGLVQLGLQARADRYTYLPLQGLAILLAWGVTDLVPAHRRRLLGVAAAAALAALAVVTRLQLRHWENSLALFTRAVSVTERNFYAHERLGYELLEAGRAEEARDQYLEAIAIAPWYTPLYYSLGLAQERAGDRDAAVVAYRTAVRLQPDLAEARGALGLLLLETGNLAGARVQLREATRAMPDSIRYREGLDEVERRLASPAAGSALP